MLTILAIPLSFFAFLILTRTVGVWTAGMYHMGNEQNATMIAFVFLFVFSLIAGVLGGYFCRERVAPLFAGIIAAIYILSVNDGSLISQSIFYAPYASLASDNVLLGLSIVLFTFLWGGKLGEQYGFRRDRNQLLPDGV